MANTTGIFSKKTEVRQKLDAMITRGSSNEAFFIRVAYPLYQARQMRRWITENASEGQKWAPLNEKYKEWKRRHFAGYAGNGEKMLIATGKLASSVIGRELKGDIDKVEIVFNDEGKPKRITTNLSGGGMKHHFAAVTNKQLHVWTDVEYAATVNRTRPIWKFGEDFNKRLRAAYKGWFTTGQVRVKP